MSKLKQKHRYIVCGEILFSFEQDGETQISTVKANAVITTKFRNVTVKDLGQAQQILQLNVHRRMDGQVINVVDVVILSMSYLGFQTEKDFQAIPEGMELRETDQAEVPLDNLPLIH